LAAEGDAFQRAVWDIVHDIPFGETTTYGRIAEQLGDRTLAQKVGQAVGANPLSIFVPCHRVLGSNGSLTGYAGGLSRKKALLELEEPAQVSAGRLF
jgi:methylated-DNA-[protein]-cysteine S-methyltransferase